MEKFDRALDLMEHPERYSECEISAILEDDEIREIYNTLCMAETSLQPEMKLPAEKVDEEWRRFSGKGNFGGRRRKGFPSRWKPGKYVAAAMASGIALGAVALGMVMKSRPEAQESDAVKVEPAGRAMVLQKDTALRGDLYPRLPSDTIILFENESLGDILGQITSFYGMQLKVENPESMGIRLFFRWETKNGEEEVVKRLNNFEKINVFLAKDTVVVR